MKKANLFFSLGISILFVFIGYYLYFEKESDLNLLLLKIVGGLCMVFFGIIALINLKKIISK